MISPVTLSANGSSGLLICILLLTAACDSAVRPPPDAIAERLASHVSARSDSVRRLRVGRRGETKDALVLLAPATVSAVIGECAGPCVFRALITPVFNVGDGLEVDFWVSEGNESRKIYSRYFDPGRRLEDRSWIPVRVPVGISGLGAQLEIRVSGGPHGDLTGDWLAFADMRIMQEAEEK